MEILQAKQSLDKVIDKARVHLYKPIQIAEILYQDRVHADIDLADLNTYRNASKKWRDVICRKFLGRTSTSSARYQDDVFNENAIPLEVLTCLGEVNRKKKGVVEAYIYAKFLQRFSQMAIGLDYSSTHDRLTFRLDEFIAKFWNEPGLKRSIDKIYEIVVYTLFSTLIDALDVTVEIHINPQKTALLNEFEDFAKRVIQLDTINKRVTVTGKIHRVGVTNASDRGLDMWANFGLAIQIKHLSLTEELAENIVSSVTSDRIVIVCKDSEEKIIVSLLNQIGWKSKIQSIITERDLLKWYEQALRGSYSSTIGDKVLSNLIEEIKTEFPTTDHEEFSNFYKSRGYDKMIDSDWKS